MNFFKTLLCLLVATLLLAHSQGQESAKQERRKNRKAKKRASVLYEGQAAIPDCSDCFCLVHYTLKCDTCAPQTEMAIPCGTTIMELMIMAADKWDADSPDADSSNNPYAFTTEYRGSDGQAVVGMAGVVPTDATWQLYINGRHVNLDIKNAKVTRGGDSVTFRLVPKPTAQKRSAADVQQRSPGSLSPKLSKLDNVLSKTKDVLTKAAHNWRSKRSAEANRNTRLDEPGMDDVADFSPDDLNLSTFS